MNDKKIKKAIQQYIEKQTDTISSEAKEAHDLSALDRKVYATLDKKQDRHKMTATWSFKKISALAASLVLIIGLSITAIFLLNRKPIYIVQNDVNYTITISYENEQYGYYSNRAVIDKYGLKDIPDLKQNPDLFTGSLSYTDIIQIDSVIDKNDIIGAPIYPYSNDIIILQGEGQLYYFEKIETK